ncbi:MAG: hypothetical protein ACE5DM_04520 [Candidatus Nanoarchaeia archaeon]
MKGRYADRLRRINEKKKSKIRRREPDFIVREKKKPKSMEDCKPEQAFHLADGQKVNNLHELATAFGSMHDDVFNHHVNDEKNDFSSWVSVIIKEGNLAEELKKTKDRKEHHRKLLRHVVNDMTNYIQ